MRRSLCWTILGLVIGAAGCDEAADTTVQVELYTPDGQEDLLSAAGPADLIELVVKGEDGKPTTALLDATDPNRRARVTGLPFGRNFRMFVRGFNNGDAQAVVYFYGSSAPFDVTEGGEARISVQVGQVDCIGLNRASPRFRSADGKDDLNTLRVGMSVTALPDGRVLIAGGAQVDAQGNVVQVLDTMEVFDPARSEFQLLPFRMKQPRAHHTATRLASGQILMFGGFTRVEPDPVPVSTAELIAVDDLAAPVREVPLGIAVAPRYMHQATLLDDGRDSVLFTGGVGADGAPLASAFRFFPGQAGDPAQGTWLAQVDMHTPRAWHTASRVLRSNEKAVVVGGLGPDSAATDGIEVFTINPNPAQRGCVGDAQPSADVGCFIKPLGGRLGEARWAHTAVEIDGGRQVAIMGGYGAADRSSTTNTLEILNADDLSVISDGAGELLNGRGELASIGLEDGTILAIGGRRAGTPLAVSSRLRPNRDAASGKVTNFSVTPFESGCGLTEPRYGVGVAQLQNGTVLMLGGVTGRRPGELVASRRAELFFPRVNEL